MLQSFLILVCRVACWFLILHTVGLNWHQLVPIIIGITGLISLSYISR